MGTAIKVSIITKTTQEKKMLNEPELRSRPGLKARLLTVGESLSQQIVLETLVLKFPSNLNTRKKKSQLRELIECVDSLGGKAKLGSP